MGDSLPADGQSVSSRVSASIGSSCQKQLVRQQHPHRRLVARAPPISELGVKKAGP